MEVGVDRRALPDDARVPRARRARRHVGARPVLLVLRSERVMLDAVHVGIHEEPVGALENLDGLRVAEDALTGPLERLEIIVTVKDLAGLRVNGDDPYGGLLRRHRADVLFVGELRGAELPVRCVHDEPLRGRLELRRLDRRHLGGVRVCLRQCLARREHRIHVDAVEVGDVVRVDRRQPADAIVVRHQLGARDRHTVHRLLEARVRHSELVELRVLEAELVRRVPHAEEGLVLFQKGDRHPLGIRAPREDRLPRARRRQVHRRLELRMLDPSPGLLRRRLQKTKGRELFRGSPVDRHPRRLLAFGAPRAATGGRHESQGEEQDLLHRNCILRNLRANRAPLGDSFKTGTPTATDPAAEENCGKTRALPRGL